MLIRLVAATSFVALMMARDDRPAGMLDQRVIGIACRAADSVTAREINRWQTKMHSANAQDSLDVVQAELLFVPDSAFAVVTDSVICATALAAHNSDSQYDATELASAAASTVYAIRVGSRYITWNSDFRSGEFVTHTVWNGSFVALEHYLY